MQYAQKPLVKAFVRQTAEIFQLSNLELYNKINTMLLENPVIEEISSFKKNSAENDFYSKNDEVEKYISEEKSLQEHLIFQVGFLSTDENEQKILKDIITAIDDNGFIESDNINFFREKYKIKDIESYLDIIRSLDPSGCGSENVQEALLYQSKNIYPDDKLIIKIIKDLFISFRKQNYSSISKELNLSLEEVISKIDLIKRLNPFPGRGYSNKQSNYIRPDARVEILNGNLSISILDDWIPELGINTFYIHLLNKKDIDPKEREYIKDKIIAAKNFIKTVEMRKKTFHSTVESIMERQKNFLLNGPGHLKYLTKKEIAKRVDLNESTISRIAGKKYVETRWGIYSINYFFISRVPGSDIKNKNSFSSDYIKSEIKNIIKMEEKKIPFSDEEIRKNLLQGGIKVARRTVAKYRGVLDIPSSMKRKKI